MSIYSKKLQEHTPQTNATAHFFKAQRIAESHHLDNHSPHSIASRQIKEISQQSHKLTQLKAFQDLANQSTKVQKGQQFQAWVIESPRVKSTTERVRNANLPIQRVNEDGAEARNDQKIQYNRLPKTTTDTKKRSWTKETSGPDRVVPKLNSGKTVSNAVLIKDTKGPNEKDWHWTLECEVEGGKSKKTISMDLQPRYHRVHYGASERVSKKKGNEEYDIEDYEAIPFTLQVPKPVHEVYKAMEEVAKDDEGWTGTAGYNCQNFVLAMLKKLEVNESELLNTEADWREDQRMYEDIDLQFAGNKIDL